MAACIRVIVCLILLIAINLCDPTSGNNVRDHLIRRTRIIGQEALMSLGGGLQLTDQEQFVNEIMMKYKTADLDESYADAAHFLGRKHFFHTRNEINEKRIFNFIKKMPKGAALHLHDVGILDVDYVVKNITYRNNLYMCYVNNEIKLQFMSSAQSKNRDVCKWLLVNDARESSRNTDKFDNDLKTHFTMWDESPESSYPDDDAAWVKFQGLFAALFPMLTYEPVWRDYFYESLKQFHNDNIMYLELRSVLPNLYDFERQYDQIHTVRVLEEVVSQFKETHPDFFDVKLIYAPSRIADRTEMSRNVKFATLLKNEFPNFFAGFDLVGKENTKPLLEFVEELSVLKNISVVYHSGETNWYGFPVDYNLVDAVIFGAKRLGHAYALIKHPKVMEIIQQEEIALEINPISNQVLKLVDDLRNHPAAPLLANNYPIVISSDDPGLWGALPLSHDFYVVFNYIASRNADLRMLKQLAINSLNFSLLSVSEKYEALNHFNQKWTKFIEEEIHTFSTYLHYSGVSDYNIHRKSVVNML